MTNPVYPNNVLAWTDRQDDIDIIWAEDPNALAAEVTAVEGTLGPMPHLEANPPVGPAIQFSNVGQRLDYITAGQQLPVIELRNSAQQIASGQQSSTQYGIYNTYPQVTYDPYGFYNGADVTVPVTGWYSINGSQFWDWDDVGYVAMSLWVGAAEKDIGIWHWDFPGNDPNGPWRAGGEIWRAGNTSVHWEGIINAGQRIRIVSENGTDTTPMTARDLELTMQFHRLTPSAPLPTLIPAPPLVIPPPATVTRYPGVTGLSVSNEGSGTLSVSFSRVTTPSPLPTSYTAAIYNTSANFGSNYLYAGAETLVSLTTIQAPQSPGTQTAAITNLPTGYSYQVRVWPNGGLLAAPVAIQNISI